MSEYSPNDLATKKEVGDELVTVFFVLLAAMMAMSMGASCADSKIRDRLKAAEKRIETLEFNDKLRR